VFATFHRKYFGRDYSPQQSDSAIATQYFQDRPNRTALEVANYLLCAWTLIGQHDGKYGYGCCQQTDQVAEFFRYLERTDGKRGIVEDVESVYEPYWDGDEKWLLESLCRACDDREAMTKIFADEHGRITEDRQAGAQTKRSRTADAEQQRERAEKQAQAAMEAEWQARTRNPSDDDVASAVSTISSIYESALGNRNGRSSTQRQFAFACAVLEYDCPALHEYCKSHGTRSAPPDSAKPVPAKLQTRLKHEYDKFRKAVSRPASAISGSSADSPQLEHEPI
jgi:hypothetical protein